MVINTEIIDYLNKCENNDATINKSGKYIVKTRLYKNSIQLSLLVCAGNPET